MTLRVNRSLLSDYEAQLLDDACARQATKREANKAAARCINENSRGGHGLATHGVRCLRCDLVHRLGASVAREKYEYVHFQPVLPEAS